MIDEIFIPILAISGTFIWLIVTFITGKIAEMYKFSRLVRMKERMLEAGMTAAEIERVASAGMSGGQVDKTQKKPAIYNESMEMANGVSSKRMVQSF